MTVKVNGKQAIVHSNNTFELLLGVNEGDVVVTVKATDRAGNESEKIITFEYRKD